MLGCFIHNPCHQSRYFECIGGWRGGLSPFVILLPVFQLQAGQGGGQVGVDCIKAYLSLLVPWLPGCGPLLLQLPRL